MTVRRALRTGFFALLGLALFLAVWEIYKNLGPARGVQVAGGPVLPRTADSAMPHLLRIWDAFGQPEVNTTVILLGPPKTVFESVLAAALHSLWWAGVGMVVGVVVGMLLAVLMDALPIMERALLPWIVLSQTVPRRRWCWPAAVAAAPAAAPPAARRLRRRPARRARRTRPVSSLPAPTAARRSTTTSNCSGPPRPSSPATSRRWQRASTPSRGLNVELLQGGVDIVPQNVLANGQADYAIAWVPKALQSREQGAEITDVGQVFQRFGTLQVSFKDKNITTPEDLNGKIVGNWGFGNEYELFAGMTKAGLDPGVDVTIAQQDFNMNAMLNGDIDAAQAMLLTASYQGWIYCAENPEECRDLVVAAGSKLGASHQLWQMNEINKLIWPSPDGIGMVDDALWNQSVEIAKTTKNADGATVLTADPTEGAYTNDYTEQALAKLKEMNLDTTGSAFTPIEVTLNAGGN